MKKCEKIKCRRWALGWTVDTLAEKAGIDPKYVKAYEAEERVPVSAFRAIDNTIWEALTSLSEIEHYKVKILELAFEIRNESENDELMREIGHLLVEAGKLQMDSMRNRI